MKKTLLLLFFALSTQLTIAQDEFITIWEVDNFIKILTLPAQPDAISYTIDWGDGTTDSTVYTTESPTHTYASGGEYEISMTGTFPHLQFHNQAPLKGVKQWGTQQWTSMALMFYGCKNFNSLPSEAPDLTLVVNMQNMFTSATSFNQDISNWDVSNVKYLSSMFYGATSFNQDIGNWDVSNVTIMMSMFWAATSFNQDISKWDVGEVTRMDYMFSQAPSFNQDIGSWNVGKVTNMSNMFWAATSFNQDISKWDVRNVTNMGDMFRNATLSTENYDALLIGWPTKAASNGVTLQNNVNFTGGNSYYCNGEDARDYLTGTLGWNISDLGLDCSTLALDDLDTGLVSIYPNPTSESLNIQITPELLNESYKIYDVLGKTMLEGTLKSDQTNINVENLSNGIYFISLGNNKASKFIKQ